jgi:hypothetical protein
MVKFDLVAGIAVVVLRVPLLKQPPVLRPVGKKTNAVVEILIIHGHFVNYGNWPKDN